MVAYFSGVVQPPIMLGSLIAYATSRLVYHECVYDALARSFVAAEGAYSQPRSRNGSSAVPGGAYQPPAR
jgi:hypothetical protein